MYFLRIHVFKIRQKKAMILDEKEGLRHGSLRSDAMKTGYGAPFPEKFCGRVKRPLQERGSIFAEIRRHCRPRQRRGYARQYRCFRVRRAC